MTFSLIARDSTKGSVGIAVSTASAAVGKRVPHYRKGVGLVATQGKTNVLYGNLGLKLMEIGFTPPSVLRVLMQEDENNQYRQVLVTDLSGCWAVHTGDQTEGWHGHLIAKDYVSMGNTLPGKQVLDAMAEGFENTSGELAIRLMAGLKRGQDAGGDREGKCSAALLVLSPHEFQPWGSLVDLRVDFDPDPVYKLSEILTLYLEWEKKKLREIDKKIYGFHSG